MLADVRCALLQAMLGAQRRLIETRLRWQSRSPRSLGRCQHARPARAPTRGAVGLAPREALSDCTTRLHRGASTHIGPARPAANSPVPSWHGRCSFGGHVHVSLGPGWRAAPIRAARACSSPCRAVSASTSPGDEALTRPAASVVHRGLRRSFVDDRPPRPGRCGVRDGRRSGSGARDISSSLPALVEEAPPLRGCEKAAAAPP